MEKIKRKIQALKIAVALKAISIGYTFASVKYLMTIGVAFRKSPHGNVPYEIYSHEGDYVAELPVYLVETMVAHMRKKGVEPGYVKRGVFGGQPGFTFAWEGY